MAQVGILVNPVSGRDVRRLAARAGSSTPQDKRNQVARVAIGAAAAGAKRILVARDPFRISVGAVENLRIPAEFEILDIAARLTPDDTRRAALRMREAGCGAVVVLGGDGTNRVVTSVWPDAPLVPLSTGTNNVFPRMLEPTIAGAAAGVIASGAVATDEAAPRAKIVRAEIDGETPDSGLVDAAFLIDDSVGNLMPFDPSRLRRLVLARAEPDAVGMSPIGGLLVPCSASDDFGVSLRLVRHGEPGRTLLAPVSPGLYRNVHVGEASRLELGSEVEVRGPGVLAFDGDRERTLGPGVSARLRVERDGPRVIDVARTMRLAAERGVFVDRGPWHDSFDGGGFDGCC